MADRICFVRINSVDSFRYKATSGVPQGSILGPLLFVLFVNDVSSYVKWSKVLLYADDLKLFLRIRSMADVLNLQSDLSRISQWCSDNLLDINVSKCCKVSFGKCRNFMLFDYVINGITLKSNEEKLDLGVVFDYKFNFVNHLNSVIPKSYSLLGFIKRNCREFSDPYTVKLVYSSLVRSKLEYASFIWNPFCVTHISRIERIQRKFIKFALHNIHFTQPEPSYEDKCRLIGLKTLENRRKYLSQVFLYKIICGFVDCSELLDLINFHVPPRILRNHNLFVIPFHRTNYSMFEPLSRVLNEYNRISDNLDFSDSLKKYCQFLDLIYF